MFTQIHLENFRSFENIDFKLLDKKGQPKKLVLIYGANSSGKTNLASAFAFLKESMRTMAVHDLMQMLLERQRIRDGAIHQKPTSDSSTDDMIPPSNEDSSNNNLSQDIISILEERINSLEKLIAKNKMIDSVAPMVLDYEFRIGDRSGRYTIKTNNEQLINERLEYVLNKNKVVYFDITPDSFSLNAKIFKSRESYRALQDTGKMFWGKHTLLSILIHEMADKSDDFLRNQLIDNFSDLIGLLSGLSYKIGEKSYLGNINNSIPIDILRSPESGHIPLSNEKQLDMVETLLNTVFKTTHINLEKLYYKRTCDNDTVKYDLMESKKIAGKIREIPFSMESGGTRQLLCLLPYMLIPVYGADIIIDEFGTGIHDQLDTSLISSLASDLNGQIILTTHNTNLLKTCISKDCIYTIHEDENGNRDIKPITTRDQHISKKTNIQTQYLEGQYGGTPKIKDGVLDLRRCLKVSAKFLGGSFYP